jgi:hypothetical protein
MEDNIDTKTNSADQIEEAQRQYQTRGLETEGDAEPKTLTTNPRRVAGVAEAQRLWDLAVPIKELHGERYSEVLRYLHNESDDGMPPDRLIAAVRDKKTGEIIGAGVIELYYDGYWCPIWLTTLGATGPITKTQFSDEARYENCSDFSDDLYDRVLGDIDDAHQQIVPEVVCFDLFISLGTRLIKYGWTPGRLVGEVVYSPHLESVKAPILIEYGIERMPGTTRLIL